MLTEHLHVNGERRAFSADLSAPLLYILRNDFGLKGPRFGCGLGQCGICSVLLDGMAIRSCLVPVGAALERDGHKILTLEGLGNEQRPHPVQQAFIDEQAVQCGYCVNGQIIGAIALLNANPAPTSDEIKESMAPYLCRCGTHPRVVRAIHRAAAELRGRRA